MSLPLLLILWPASVFFTTVLSFRVGYWWKAAELHGRHAAGNVAQTDDPWDDDEVLDSEPEWDQSSPNARPPARPVRWWSEEDETEELPQIRDRGPSDWQ